MTRAYLIVILVLFSAGCSPLGSSQPEFINHEKPEVAQDISVFDEAGCPANEYGTRRCQPGSPLQALGCSRIQEPKALLGFLEPQVPIMTCVIDPVQAADPYQEIERLRDEGSFITSRGGLDPEFYRFVVYQENEYVEIATLEDFKAFFAPVNSAEEALSYALALTPFRAYYGLGNDSDLEYFVSTLEDTHVVPVTTGYEVHLYHYREIGCGPHPTSLVIMHVSQEGELTERSRQEVFKDPAEDNLCID